MTVEELIGALSEYPNKKAEVLIIESTADWMYAATHSAFELKHDTLVSPSLSNMRILTLDRDN